MKKSNMLIAVFAVLAAASVAKAGEIEINFDGTKGLKPQSMHDIFANSHQLVSVEQAGILPVAAPATPQNMSQAVYDALAAYHVAQPKIKMLVAGYYLGRGEAAAAAGLSDKKTRIIAANSSVVVIRDGVQELIKDPQLAARVEAMAFPGGQQKAIWSLIVGGAELIDVATNNDAWNAVGDAVSSASEAITHYYYTEGAGAGQQQGLLTGMPD